MNDRIIYISLVSFIPTLILLGYIYMRDRVEKEPVGLLFTLFGVGAVGFLPAFYLSRWLSNLLDGFFESYRSFDVNGMVDYSDSGAMYAHRALYAFVCIAVVAEAFKWVGLWVVTRRNKNFNCLFDGIVYSVFVSLGFGVVESLRYALVDGWDSLLFRFFSLVPNCFFYGVITGVFYTMWFVHRKARREERQLIAEGKIQDCYINNPIIWLILSFVVPVLVHGVTEFAEVMGERSFELVKYSVLFALYIACFFITYHFSKWDDEVHDIAAKVVQRKHPELKEKIEIVEVEDR